MIGKRMFWGVVSLAVLTLMACIATFSVLAGSFQGEVILLNFAVNVPMCMIIGYADYKMVAFLHKCQKNADALSIVASVIVSNLAIGSLFVLYYLISSPVRLAGQDGLLQRLLPVVLCNSIIVLIIEAFFYNNLFLANKARLAKVEQEKAKYQLENLKANQSAFSVQQLERAFCLDLSGCRQSELVCQETLFRVPLSARHARRSQSAFAKRT